METPDNDTIGGSRGNSLSSGDPNLKSNQGNTSTDPTSSENTGESAPQQGENIVNEQEQNKPVNMEEFVENNAQNRLGDDEGSLVPGDGPREVPEIQDDSDDTDALPTMTSGAL